ncbi:MAG: GNAT family N-acetyltransferase [Paracoccaceae bacterium]
MSAAIHLAGPDDFEKVLVLVTTFHGEVGIESTEDIRRAGIEPLLNGSPYGVIYLIGPTRAPVGYIAITFGWSLEFGGMDGFVDELFIRPAVRGRGVASEVLTELPKALAQAGLKALHLEVDREDEAAQRLYLRSRFKPRDHNILMTKQL